jgi:hypothetical protein
MLTACAGSDVSDTASVSSASLLAGQMGCGPLPVACGGTDAACRPPTEDRWDAELAPPEPEPRCYDTYERTSRALHRHGC